MDNDASVLPAGLHTLILRSRNTGPKTTRCHIQWSVRFAAMRCGLPPHSLFA